jgi:hypothetical protein
MAESAALYLQGERTGEVLDAYFQAVLEWLQKEKFADSYDTRMASWSIGRIYLRTADGEQWFLYYEDQPTWTKDSIGNAIVLAKKQEEWRYGPTDKKIDLEPFYLCRIFQCDLADSNLWERTVNALRAFRYTHWSK